MSRLPMNQRSFHAFLSHSHADKQIVEKLYTWLNEIAGIPVWYDGRHLPPSTRISAALASAIGECQATIIVLSSSSLASGWVEEEYEYSISQRAAFKENDFRIIPVRIEDCEIPGFLNSTKWIDMLDGALSPQVCTELLEGLYYRGITGELGQTRDIYISRSWHPDEAHLADYVCRMLLKAGFRLVGDSKDQPGFGGGERVESLISSCGCLVAIVPHRGGGSTSRYILQEIEAARKLNIPLLVVAEPDVSLPEDLAAIALRIAPDQVVGTPPSHGALSYEINNLVDDWQPPKRPHYFFYATDLDAMHKSRNLIVQRIIQSVTAMPCLLGDEILQGNIRQAIKERISQSLVMIADITDNNLNTCIEAGIALGADTRLHLLAQGTRHSPPFMLRDEQLWTYQDDVELLGRIHRLTYPYRRRILNYELPKN